MSTYPLWYEHDQITLENDVRKQTEPWKVDVKAEKNNFAIDFPSVTQKAATKHISNIMFNMCDTVKSSIISH